MKRQRITLVQTIEDLDAFYELREKEALPLVLKLHKAEIDTLKISGFKHFPSSISAPYLYKRTALEDEEKEYCVLSEISLGKLIENFKIYIPEFIDMDGNRRFIDYILQTYHSVYEDSCDWNLLCTDYSHKILFREKKRFFESLGSNIDFVRGQFKENPNARDLADIWKETIENKEKIEQNKEKIKSLL